MEGRKEERTKKLIQLDIRHGRIHPRTLPCQDFMKLLLYQSYDNYMQKYFIILSVINLYHFM